VTVRQKTRHDSHWSWPVSLLSRRCHCYVSWAWLLFWRRYLSTCRKVLVSVCCSCIEL